MGSTEKYIWINDSLKLNMEFSSSKDTDSLFVQ